MHACWMATSLALLAACSTPTSPVAPGEPLAATQRKMPPLGGPLPPTRVQGYCEADADCSLRTGHDGCGTCVGRGDPVDLPATGASTCGMQQTEGCRCVDRRCAARPRMVDSPVQQAAPEDDSP